MDKVIDTRQFSMADADLKQLADGLENTIIRDAIHFATRNIGAAQLAAYNQLINEFANTPTDVELKGLVTDAAQHKNDTLSDVHKAIRTIRSMAEQAYNKKGKYKTFGFKDVARLSDNDLCRIVKRIVRMATILQADLAHEGLTTAQLTNLATLGALLDERIDKIYEAEELRDLQTHERVQKGNQLYLEMMRLASIGKSLFADTDEARYNYYVLIGSRAKAKTANPEDAENVT